MTVPAPDPAAKPAPPLGPKRTPPPPPAASSGKAPCREDSDCVLTFVPEGGCCRSLCQPRAVSPAEARLTDERVAQCEKESRPCAIPMCRARAWGASCGPDGTCTVGIADNR